MKIGTKPDSKGYEHSVQVADGFYLGFFQGYSSPYEAKGRTGMYEALRCRFLLTHTAAGTPLPQISQVSIQPSTSLSAKSQLALMIAALTNQDPNVVSQQDGVDLDKMVGHPVGITVQKSSFVDKDGRSWQSNKIVSILPLPADLYPTAKQAWTTFKIAQSQPDTAGNTRLYIDEPKPITYESLGQVGAPQGGAQFGQSQAAPFGQQQVAPAPASTNGQFQAPPAAAPQNGFQAPAQVQPAAAPANGFTAPSTPWADQHGFQAPQPAYAGGGGGAAADPLMTEIPF